MDTKEKARQKAGRIDLASTILARVRSAIKSAVVTLALWKLLPYGVAEALIRRFRLGGA